MAIQFIQVTPDGFTKLKIHNATAHKASPHPYGGNKHNQT